MVSVTDCLNGQPAIGMSVRLYRRVDGTWLERRRDRTGEDGRISGWSDLPRINCAYRLEFDLDEYFSSLGVASLYPGITIDFRITDITYSRFIFLLVTPSSYFTYQRF